MATIRPGTDTGPEGYGSRWQAAEFGRRKRRDAEKAQSAKAEETMAAHGTAFFWETSPA